MYNFNEIMCLGEKKERLYLFFMQNMFSSSNIVYK